MGEQIRATRATRTPITVEQPATATNINFDNMQTATVTTNQAAPESNPWTAFAETDSDIERETTKAGEELLAYVDKQIQRMNSKVSFNSGNITLYELDVALSTYEPTLFALTALYEQARFDAEVAKEKYNEWYYDKYMEIRNTYNTKDVKTAQWLSSKEIDATLFKIYRKEAAKLKAETIKAEGQRSTVERLLKGWENYAFILGQLSKNVNAQMMGSSISVDMRRGDDTI
jgi:hypothetical protein